MFRIEKNCPFCRYGTIVFGKCSDNKTIVLICEECESIWLDPQKVGIEYMLDAPPPGYYVATLECCSIALPPARWATEEEILERGWGKYIAGTVPPLGGIDT